MRRKALYIFLVLLMMFMSFTIIGCSKVDEKTQRFADEYNYTYTVRAICLKEKMTLSQQLPKINNNKQYLSVAQRIREASRIYAEAEPKLAIMRSNPLFKKAKEAGILEENSIDKKSLDEQYELAKKYYKKLYPNK